MAVSKTAHLGSNPDACVFGSWLSLRLCGRSNYRTAISVRNLAGAHAVPTGRCFLETRYVLSLYGKLAQLVEHQTVNLTVNGSIPLFSVSEILSCFTV